MNLSEIKAECVKLDVEYRTLFDQILSKLNQLSQVSLEFVNSKLSFLECYTLTFQDFHLEARQHRNNQLKNLLEYIRTHQQMQIRSAANSPIGKSVHSSSSCHQPPVENKGRSSAFYKDFNNNNTTSKKLSLMLNNIVSQPKGDKALQLLVRAMKLLEANQQFYFKDYQLLNLKYQKIVKQSEAEEKKRILEMESNKIKENLDGLMKSQRSFQSYLKTKIK